MKNQKKTIITFLLGITFLFTLLTLTNYAVEENTNTQNSSNTQTDKAADTNTNASNNNTAKKSNNANLSNLGIRPHDFKGFRAATTNYEVVVPEDTQEVEVYAKAQHAKAKVTGTGKKKLEIGENKVEVVVTAEDGTQKTYTIHIVREVAQETNGEEEEINLENGNGLSELKINDLSLSPEFKTDIYEYTVKYIGEDTKLQIDATPTSQNYTIEIVGNEDLKEGENTITILVSEKNGTNVATYQVTVNKSLVDLEAIAKEQEQKKEREQKIIIGAIIVAILVVIAIFFIQRKRNRDWQDDWEEELDEKTEEMETEEEMPKALRKNKTKKNDVLEEEEEIHKMSKEDLKETFLNNYANREEDYGEEETKKKKRKPKGKRFK